MNPKNRTSIFEKKKRKGVGYGDVNIKSPKTLESDNGQWENKKIA
jgi:hypothetical protein